MKDFDMLFDAFMEQDEKYLTYLAGMSKIGKIECIKYFLAFNSQIYNDFIIFVVRIL
jgi:hypothetical protein